MRCGMLSMMLSSIWLDWVSAASALSWVVKSSAMTAVATRPSNVSGKNVMSALNSEPSRRR